MTAAFLACFILAGLYLREKRTSARLRRDIADRNTRFMRMLRRARDARSNSDGKQRLARQCMREAMRGRDEIYEELIEERKRAYEMRLELDEYRKEERGRMGWKDLTVN